MQLLTVLTLISKEKQFTYLYFIKDSSLLDSCPRDRRRRGEERVR